MQEINQDDQGIDVEDKNNVEGSEVKAATDVKGETKGMQTEQPQEQGQAQDIGQDAGQQPPHDVQHDAQKEAQKGQHEEQETDELATLRAQLEKKEAEAKAHYDLFLRERADLENFKRRMQRDKSEALKFANEPLIRDLLSVVDNLERATAHAQEGGDGQSLAEGVSLVLRSFSDVLEKYGTVRIAAKGEPFDPSKHEAMAQVETTEYAPNTVVEEHMAGYSLHDRLLRAAMVSVAKAPAAAEAAPEGQEGQSVQAAQEAADVSDISEKKSGD